MSADFGLPRRYPVAPALPEQPGGSGMDDRAPSSLMLKLPGKIGAYYLLATFATFLMWPINWQIYRWQNWVTLIAYVLLCIAVIAVSFRIAVIRPVPLSVPGKAWQWLIPTGGVLAVLLLFPLSITYTGSWPWQFFEVLGQQGDAYSQLQRQLAETTGQRGPIAALRFVLAPIIFGVLPLGIIYWRRLSWVSRLAVVAAAMSSVVFSVLRGTDRELVDILIIATSAILVAIGRQSIFGTTVLAFVKRAWKPALIVALFFAFAASLFVERKSARLGGYEERVAVCANASRICADIDAPAIQWMPLSARFGVSVFVLSATSGYYGLALAMEQPFQSTYGVGHSPAALTIYEALTNDAELKSRTYTYRNAFSGWSEENYWSTLITWIANDIGLVGAIVVLSFLGFGWGRAWKAATVGHNDGAAVLFCLFMIMIYYLPANNQVFAGYEGYSIFLTWLCVWKLGSKTATDVTGRVA